MNRSIPLQNPDTSRSLIDNHDGSLNQYGANTIQGLIDRTGGPNGLPSVEPVTAGGTSTGAASSLTGDINDVTNPVSATGWVLLIITDPGAQQLVYNDSANSLNVYPPSGMKIDALAANAAYVLAAGKSQIFTCYSATQIRSLQLG